MSEGHQRLAPPLFFALFGFGLGFYDGFGGPATGTFWVVSLVFFLGFDLAKATAYTKIFNLKSGLIGAACFAVGHHINYPVAAAMACGQLIGGRLGSRLVIANGARFVRPTFLGVVFLAILVAFYKNWPGSA